MLPANTLAAISNVVALNLEPRTTMAVLGPVLAPLLQSSEQRAGRPRSKPRKAPRASGRKSGLGWHPQLQASPRMARANARRAHSRQSRLLP